MFSSFLRLFGASPADIITSERTPEAQDFANFALESPYPILRFLGEIIDQEPYAFFVLSAGFCFSLFLFLRWAVRINDLYNKSAKSQVHRIIKDSFHFLFSWRFTLCIVLILGVVLTSVLGTYKDLGHIIRLILFSCLLYILYQAVRCYTRAYFRKIAMFPKKRGLLPKSHNLRLLSYRFLQGLWVIVFVSFLLGLWGVHLGSILAGLGVVGVVAGLAMQDVFSHLVGGISLMLDETYSVGDVVKLENGIEGIIFEIGLRSTKIRTWDEEIVNIPNGLLSKMTITNLSQPVERKRIRLTFQVDASSASPELVTQVLHEAVSFIPQVLSNPAPYTALVDVKANALVFRMVFYVDSVLIKTSTSDEVLHSVLRFFKKNNIRLIPDESLVHITNK